MPNIALGKRALQASQEYNHVAGFAVDGNMATFSWSTHNHETSWLLLDLRRHYQVMEVVIAMGTYSCKYT